MSECTQIRLTYNAHTSKHIKAPLRMVYASFLVVISELLRTYPTSTLDYRWCRRELSTSGGGGGAGGGHQLDTEKV